MLDHDRVEQVGLELGQYLTTPHALSVLCNLNGQALYTSWVNATPDELVTFCIGLLDTAIDAGAHDDNVLEAQTKLRQYIGNKGAGLRPANEQDFDESPEER